MTSIIEIKLKSSSASTSLLVVFQHKCIVFIEITIWWVSKLIFDEWWIFILYGGINIPNEKNYNTNYFYSCIYSHLLNKLNSINDWATVQITEYFLLILTNHSVFNKKLCCSLNWYILKPWWITTIITRAWWVSDVFNLASWSYRYFWLKVTLLKC